MKRILIIVAVVVVLAAVVGSVLKGRGKAEARVETGKVEARDLTSIVDCSGTIEPKRKVDVSANAMGTIVKLAVVEGQQVQAGDLLMEIDPSEYRAAVDALQAGIRSARADLELATASWTRPSRTASGPRSSSPRTSPARNWSTTHAPARASRRPGWKHPVIACSSSRPTWPGPPRSGAR